MHHKSGKHDLQSELHQLVDVVAPKVEFAVDTVTEKATPLVEQGRAVAGTVAGRGRTVAVEKGTLLAERLPDSVVDRLPGAVVDKLPVRRRGRGRKLLLLGLLGGVAVAGVAAARKSGMLGGSSGRHGGSSQASQSQGSTSSSGPATGTTTGPTTMTSEAVDQPDPSDPLVEPRVNGRIN